MSTTPATQAQPEFLTIRQVAEITNMSVRHWRNRIRAREVSINRFGRVIRIRRNELERMIRSCEIPAAE